MRKKSKLNRKIFLSAGTSLCQRKVDEEEIHKDTQEDLFAQKSFKTKSLGEKYVFERKNGNYRSLFFFLKKDLKDSKTPPTILFEANKSKNNCFPVKRKNV